MVGSKSIEVRVVLGRPVVLELDYAATREHHGDQWHGRRLLELYTNQLHYTTLHHTHTTPRKADYN